MRFILWLSKPCRRTVGRGPVPRRALGVSKNVHGLLGQRTFLVLFEGSRGTGPRATVAAAFFREIILTKNATFAKINSVLNIFGNFSR